MPRRLTTSPRLASAWGLLLDFVYPPRCGGCDRRGTWLCPECLALVRPIGDGLLLVEHLDALMCAGAFEGTLRKAIHNFKYNSDTPLAKPLAALAAGRLADERSLDRQDSEPPTLVPVPLHPARQRSRGYNQSHLLARELSRMTGWQVEMSLVRERNTRSQVGLDAQQRRENVSGAFAWTGQAVPERVVLVDDLCTTGATLSECAATLRSKGVLEVYAVTVAKAVGVAGDMNLR